MSTGVHGPFATAPHTQSRPRRARRPVTCVDAAQARTVARIRARLKELQRQLEALIDPSTWNHRLSAAIDAVADLDQAVTLLEAAQRSTP